ncbi:MAG: rod shape-determining protein MreC [Deltaproteobacteria bacterium]|nr:rod shape-determining protein MreC [Deltaproteobacteria bacterium]
MFSLLKRHQLIVTSLLLCLLSIHLIVTNKRGVGGALLVGRVLSVIATPVQYSITNITQWVSGTWSGYIYLVGAGRENDTLNKKLALLESDQARLLEEVESARRMKALLDFKEEMLLPMVAAAIIGTDTYGLTKTVTIDRGENDGVKRNMAVVTHRGIVGKVTEIYGGTSMVLLATDPRFRVDGVVQRSRVKGIIEGSGGERLILKYIRQLDDIEVGDRIISSGLGGIFAKGLTVGEVVKVEVGDDNFFKYVEVAPSVDLEKMEEVLITTESN